VEHSAPRRRGDDSNRAVTTLAAPGSLHPPPASRLAGTAYPNLEVD
jgi:hypothetical protein